MRLRSRPTLAVAAVLILAIGAGIAGIAGIALGSAAVGRDGTAGLACADVAPATGLDFRGDYGAAFGDPGAEGYRMQQNLGNGAAVGDYDGDGWLDIFLLGQAGHPSRLFRNTAAPDGSRQFTDATAAAGLAGITSNARVAQFVDLNGSGRPDLVIAADYLPGGPGGPSQIFRNDGNGVFTDVTAGSGFEPEGYMVGGMTFADYDGSGRQSIYLSYWTQELGGNPATGAMHGTWPGQNRLYRNLGGYRFEDVTESSGIGRYNADSFTAVFADFSGDGRPDIYQANDHRPDRFYLNEGGARFSDRSDEAGLTRRGNSMGVATEVGDGGALHLFITNITDPDGTLGTNIGNTYMVQAAPSDTGDVRFTNEASARGVIDTGWGWGTAFADMDGDGFADLYAVQGMRAFIGDDSPRLSHATSALFLADGSGRFARSTAPGCEIPGDQRALVVLDYDRSGSPDLLITQVDAPAVLLRNGIAGRHWLTVAPTGPGDAGINARITVTAGGRSTTQILLAGGSYLAGPPREAYFGLGNATRATSVRIAWADGTVTEQRDVAADRVLRVAHPAS